MINILNGFYRVSLKALILDESKRFLLFLENNGLWELPGGGIEFGENHITCLTRELKEESGLEILSIKKHPSYFVTGINSNGQWKANIIYEVTVKNLLFTQSEECVALQFFTKEEALKNNLYPTVKEFLKEFNPQLH